MNGKTSFLILAFLACSVASYWVGFNRGIHSNEASIETRTGIKVEQWKGIQDSYKKRFAVELEKIKNGL